MLLYENPKDKAQAKAMVELHEVGAERRTEVTRMISATRRCRKAVVKLEVAALGRIKTLVKRGPDFGFRVGTGAFAFALVLLVCRHRVRARAGQSMPSIQKFGLAFWRTSIWDPVAGEFGALPFIWGTLYSSVLALLIATPIALGIAIFISELCPASLRQPLMFLTELLAAIPSIVYGLWGIFVLVPAVRARRNVAART